jgi:hypothetical protein
MKKISTLVLLFACIFIMGCAKILTGLDILSGFVPDDPVCNEENAGILWPEREQVCIKTIHGYQWLKYQGLNLRKMK